MRRESVDAERFEDLVCARPSSPATRWPRVWLERSSRQPLRAPAEQIVQLHGLDDKGAEMFTARARAANPAAELAPDRVRAIVVELEGIPLALELAAARTASLSLGQLADSLSRPLDTLAGDNTDDA